MNHLNNLIQFIIYCINVFKILEAIANKERKTVSNPLKNKNRKELQMIGIADINSAVNQKLKSIDAGQSNPDLSSSEGGSSKFFLSDSLKADRDEFLSNLQKYTFSFLVPTSQYLLTHEKKSIKVNISMPKYIRSVQFKRHKIALEV